MMEINDQLSLTELQKLINGIDILKYILCLYIPVIMGIVLN